MSILTLLKIQTPISEKNDFTYFNFIAGVHVLRKYPEWFDDLVILNTNNLPDGEVDRTRFPRLKHYPSWGFYLKYLLYDR